MNDNYKWNNTTFNSKGIIIEKVPVIPRAKHEYTTYDIPGRSGFLTVDDKTYEGIPFSLECHFKESANINEIRAFLDGYGTLQIDNEKVYTGYISNQIDWEKISNFRKFIIQFMLQPVARALTQTTTTLTTGLNKTLAISDMYTNTNPTFEITASGNISVEWNDKTFNIYNADGTYILDCDAKVITKSGANASGSMSGDFPVLKPSNTYSTTGTITSFKVKYYKPYL